MKVIKLTITRQKRVKGRLRSIFFHKLDQLEVIDASGVRYRYGYGATPTKVTLVFKKPLDNALVIGNAICEIALAEPDDPDLFDESRHQPVITPWSY